jgi:AcrR family transcriptional regulator
MGIVERKEREREEMRRKILDTARDLFAREGYERVTMRRVADAIEYSATTIYNHFEDKDDLVEALCHEDFSRLLARLEENPLPEDPVETIRQLGLAYAHFGQAHPHQYRFMFMTPQKWEGRHHELSPPGQQAYALLRAAGAEAVATGRFKKGDVDTFTQVCWSSVHGAVALLVTYPPEQWPGGAPPSPHLVRSVIDASLAGLSAAPSASTKKPRPKRS